MPKSKTEERRKSSEWGWIYDGRHEMARAVKELQTETAVAQAEDRKS